MAADTQQADLDRLHEVIRDAVPELPADGNGYGPFDYRYASGRAADTHRIRSLLEEAGRRPAPGAV